MTANQGFSSIRLVIGIGVVLVGLVLVADNLGFADADDLFIWWPLILIAVGLTRAFSGHVPDLIFAAVFVGVGSWFLLYNLGWVDLWPWEFFWPLVLIVAGVFLTLGALRSRAANDSEDFVSAVNFLGGGNRKSTSQNFLGADLVAVMGGGEVDLRKTKIADGTVPEIRIFAMWGGLEIRVPPEWKIDMKVLPLLGGYSDETEQVVSPTSPTVVFKGAALMGGFEIKN